MRKSSKQINASPSLFSYDEQENILNLKAQLPHSFTLEKTLLTILFNSTLFITIVFLYQFIFKIGIILPINLIDIIPYLSKV